MNTHYVVYDTATGVIRLVVTGSRVFAEKNLRDGEALIEHQGFVSIRTHKIEDGAVVLK